MKIRLTFLLFGCLVTGIAHAAPQGIECRALDGSYLAVNYPEGKLLAKGPIYQDVHLWKSVNKHTRLDHSGKVVEYYFYNSGPWRQTGSRHILIEKTEQGITGKFRKVTLDDTCDVDQQFGCNEPTALVFTCQEVDVAPLPPPPPPKAIAYPVCDRSADVKDWIEKILGKNCSDIALRDEFDRQLPAGCIYGVNCAEELTIDLSNKGISHLKAGDFEGMQFRPGLKVSINLSHNGISELPENLFGDKETYGTAKFEVVDFSYNQLTTYTNFRFQRESGGKGNPTIKNLFLHHNKINFSDKIDYVEGQIENLDLSYNEISFFPESFSFGILKRANLSHNKITEQSFSRSRALGFPEKFFDLSNNPISRFPAQGLFSYVAVETLRVGGTAEIPLDITGLQIRVPSGFKNQYGLIEFSNCYGSMIVPPLVLSKKSEWGEAGSRINVFNNFTDCNVSYFKSESDALTKAQARYRLAAVAQYLKNMKLLNNDGRFTGFKTRESQDCVGDYAPERMVIFGEAGSSVGLGFSDRADFQDVLYRGSAAGNVLIMQKEFTSDEGHKFFDELKFTFDLTGKKLEQISGVSKVDGQNRPTVQCFASEL